MGTPFSFRDLRGIMLPFPTPFLDSGGVDTEALRSNISKWNKTGASGFVALGSTGERVHLSERECLEVIEAARAEVPQGTPFIVGAGQQSTQATIDESRRYASTGADALLVITPSFYRAAMTQQALADHYTAVADASPLPIILYNVPDFTGVALAAETVARLSGHPNIIGIKDSSGDAINFLETLRSVDSDFAVVTGSGPLLYTALVAGARGAILAVSCVAIDLCAAIHRAVQDGDHANGVLLQRKLTPLARAVTARFGIAGLKAALDLIGYRGGAVRAPLRSVAEDVKQELAGLIKEAAAENSEVVDRTFAGASRT
jgi:4-hydroxy-2-oxoglutarate aldolase